MKLVLLSLAVAGLASAQNSTLIPSNITSSCSTFLGTLNSDSTLSTCVQPLINTTASFSPSSGANLTSEDINETLATLCKSKTTEGCSDATIRTWLASFYGACSAELTSSSGYNAQVRELYDILYVINPLKAAVCAIDSANQDYCVNEIRDALVSNSSSTSANSTSNSTTGAVNSTSFVSFAASDAWSPVKYAAEHFYITLATSASSISRRFLPALASRADSQYSAMAVLAPNTTVYGMTNLPFMFLQPTMASKALCTPCTREIMVAYIKWESTVPYALGLSQSPILGGQGQLWSAISSTCGTAYVNAIKSEVGTLASSSNTTSAADMRWESAAGTAAVGVAVVAGAMAFLA